MRTRRRLGSTQVRARRAQRPCVVRLPEPLLPAIAQHSIYTLRPAATLRYATLRYATLRYATLRYAMLCYAMRSLARRAPVGLLNAKGAQEDAICRFRKALRRTRRPCEEGAHEDATPRSLRVSAMQQCDPRCWWGCRRRSGGRDMQQCVPRCRVSHL